MYHDFQLSLLGSIWISRRFRATAVMWKLRHNTIEVNHIASADLRWKTREKMTDEKASKESVDDPKEEQSLLSGTPTVQIIPAKKDEGKTLNLKWAHTKWYGNVKIIVMSYISRCQGSQAVKPHLHSLDMTSSHI